MNLVNSDATGYEQQKQGTENENDAAYIRQTISFHLERPFTAPCCLRQLKVTSEMRLFKINFTSWGDTAALYEKLESAVVPIFYNERDRFADMMRHCIALNGSFFNTQRMLQQYIQKAYFA